MKVCTLTVLCLGMLLGITPSVLAEDNSTLPPEWQQDSDNNKVPDFIELELGLNPQLDDCNPKACGDNTIPQKTPIKHRILVILDSSGSMAGRVQGEPKLSAAKRAVERYVSNLSPNVELALMVYGHKGGNTEQWKAESCKGIELLADFDAADLEAIKAKIARLRPTGWTPLADSLHDAQRILARDSSEQKAGQHNTVVLVTDGIETCDGDPLAQARTLKEKYGFIVDVVGFNIEKREEIDALTALASAGGGTYAGAKSGDELENYFASLNRQFRQLIESEGCITENQTDYWQCDRDVVSRVRELLRLYQQNFRGQGQREQARAVSDLGQTISKARLERSKQNYGRSQKDKKESRTQREQIRQIQGQ